MAGIGGIESASQADLEDDEIHPGLGEDVHRRQIGRLEESDRRGGRFASIAHRLQRQVELLGVYGLAIETNPFFDSGHMG